MNLIYLVVLSYLTKTGKYVYIEPYAFPIHYKITWLKSDTSTLLKGQYYNVRGVLLWQMETLF